MWIWRSEVTCRTSDIYTETGRMSKGEPDRDEEIRKQREQQQHAQRQKRALTIWGTGREKKQKTFLMTRQENWGQILWDFADHVSEFVHGVKGNGSH